MNNLDNTPDIWAEEAVEWAVNNAIVVGNNNGDLKLHDNITKQEAIILLNRLHDFIQRG